MSLGNKRNGILIRGNSNFVANGSVIPYGNCILTIEKLEVLLNDLFEAFGHGLALAYSLL